MTTAGTGVCALRQNRQKEGVHACLVLSEAEKPHLAYKGKISEGEKKTIPQTFNWCRLNY